MAPVLKFIFDLVQSLIHSQFIFTLFELIQWQTTLLVHLSLPNLQFMTLQLYCCVSYHPTDLSTHANSSIILLNPKLSKD